MPLTVRVLPGAATARGKVVWDGGDGPVSRPCALGRAGVVPAARKREGDGATPAGAYPLRRLFFRPDRVSASDLPSGGGFPVQPLTADLGWCDAPDHAEYNRLVRRPFAARHERLWREDGLYDLIGLLGHNDDPVRPGFGSAIFLHCAGPDLPPTAGCVALPRHHLLPLLRAGSRAGVILEIGDGSVLDQATRQREP